MKMCMMYVSLVNNRISKRLFNLINNFFSVTYTVRTRVYLWFYQKKTLNQLKRNGIYKAAWKCQIKKNCSDELVICKDEMGFVRTNWLFLHLVFLRRRICIKWCFFSINFKKALTKLQKWIQSKHTHMTMKITKYNWCSSN